MQVAQPATDEARYRANRQGEIDSAVVYRAMAKAESDARLASVYLRLAEVEERHLSFWEDQLRALGRDPGPRRPSWRARTMRLLAGRFGAQLVLPTVATLERADQLGYDDQAETEGTGMPEDERSHARVLRYIAGGSPVGVAGETLGKLEGRHRAPGGNALRAAVLGANDGLTSNLALVMGVAGSGLPPKAILIAGITGLLAGACSMAIGEWISVQSTHELYERQVKTEAAELLSVPDEEREELALIYEAKGLSVEEAQELADRLMAEHGTALDTMVREELGWTHPSSEARPTARRGRPSSSSGSAPSSRSSPSSSPPGGPRSGWRSAAPRSDCS